MPTKKLSSPRQFPMKITNGVLQTRLPSYADPVVRRGKRPAGVQFQSHSVKASMEPASRKRRSKAVAAEAEPLPGWPFDVPAPEPQRDLVWIEISTPWQVFEWSSSWGNPSSKDVRLDGSVDWLWQLGANPNFFSGSLPTFMGGNGHFTFYTLVPPGDSGFDVAWLADPDDQTFTNATPVPGQLTGLEDLLSTKVGDALRLWFSLGFFNAEVNGYPWPGPGFFNGGTQSIFVIYAYLDRPFRVPSIGGLIFEP